ncbi:MAG: hypothetical protein ABIQ93_00525, partial [Saprospiraceae bacterium]
MHNFDRFASNQESLAPDYGQGEFDNEYGQGESPLNEMQELELATQLMEATNDAEISKWVGTLFRKIKGAGQKFGASPEGQRLRNTFRQGARGVLQQGIRSGAQYLGRNAADRMDDPYMAYDTQQFANSAGNYYGNQAQDGLNLNPDGDNDQYGAYGDGQEELAREFVRYAADATQRLINSPYRHEYPEQAQRLAITQAARQHMPQMVKGA